MIIDSHAHYAHASFSNTFRYLSWEDTWVLKEGTLADLLDQMDRRGITMSVEPGIALDFNEKILALAERYPGRIFPAMGCHPTRSGWMTTAPGPALWLWGKRVWTTTTLDRSSSDGSNFCGFSISSALRESIVCPWFSTSGMRTGMPSGCSNSISPNTAAWSTAAVRDGM